MSALHNLDKEIIMTEEKMIEEKTKLEAELAKGQQALQALQKQQSTTISTMQRIQGALQFINEQMAEEEKSKAGEPSLQKVGNPRLEKKDESKRT